MLIATIYYSGAAPDASTTESANSEAAEHAGGPI